MAIGKPLVVTLKLLDVPIGKLALVALVIAGAWLTMSVKLCGALEPTTLLAVNVMG